MKFLLLLLLAACLPLAGAFAQRQTLPLAQDWRFLKHDAPIDAPLSEEWQTVSVPHCYNALDGQNGKAADGGYYRGPTWYQRTVDVPADWRTKRVFIRFEAAFLVSDVYFNGEHLGQHKGGFAAFCYELTKGLKFGAANELRVRVNNAKDNDVIPLSADFTMEGGIYRPVSLLVTEKTCITPLDFAGPGVYVTARNITADGADVEVETKIDDAEPPGGTWYVGTAIIDAQGKSVANAGNYAKAASSGTVKQTIHLNHPRLWNGNKDPYLYEVSVGLQRDHGGDQLKTVDAVSVPLGLRTVQIDREKGFLLNGQPYPIYGVNRHQEKKDQGWALTDADHDEDFAIIREMGATAVRLAHYQQSDHVHDIADKTGLLLWQEIPVVDYINPNDVFAENAKQQLTEMIRQGSNHPSIFTWSMFNELVHPKSPPPEKLVAELDRLARELDPTRTPACASCRPDLPALNRITEWIGFNIYPGWYVGTSDDFGPPEDFGRNVKKSVAAAGGDKRVAMSEYGAGANPAQHQEGALTQVKPGGAFHPEEWQAHVHEVAWAQARNNPDLWGTFLWAMFDFASDGRNEGTTPGINDKGMVTEDRKLRKDAFFFYQANWSHRPMVYIASRRMTPRKLAQTEIKVYSNAAEVRVRLNGQDLGARQPDEIHVCRWAGVSLQAGDNAVDAAATATDGQTLTDGCVWTLEAGPAVSPAAR